MQLGTTNIKKMKSMVQNSKAKKQVQ
uniref:Uncharacterized protein n=1 Tax=Rhizophora mucronata TaxID=61149 RepID=A0A2P2QA88_RHIMU